jgi:peptidoglycan/LPS O-acetylase OafA/YrhL
MLMAREPRAAVAAEEEFWARLTGILNSPTIPALDAIRATAVMLVIVYHFDVPYVNGAVGVEMFFVLSGFLITWVMLRERDRTGGISLTGFYWRRTLRIFPAFYAYLAFAVTIEIVRGRSVPLTEFYSAAFYLQNYFAAIAHPPASFVSHTWSLAIEEQFYLIWPVVFAMAALSRRLVPALLMCIPLIWVYRAGLHASGVGQAYIYHAFDARLDHLMIGCLAALALHRQLWGEMWRRLCANAYVPLITILLLAASSLMDLRSTSYRNVLGFTVEPILMAVLLVQLVMFHGHRLWRWVNAAPVRFVGRLSYSLYLYQQITLSVPDRWFGPEPTLIKFIAAVGVTFAFACGSYYLIERPFLQLRHRLAGRRRESSPAAASNLEVLTA